jgi:quinol monooxygenase YgiN
MDRFRHSQEVVTMYMQRVSIYPNPANIAEVRTLLIERAKARQASGTRVALSELVAGANTPQFVVSTLFEDLAAFEALRKRDQSDVDFQKFAAKIGSLIRKPAAFDLMEVLVQMPS